MQPVHPKGDQSWVFFGRNDAKAETPVLWPPHVKSWLIGKDSDAGRDWGQEKKGTTEDEMAGWHHRLDGRESEWIPGVGAGQGRLACCVRFIGSQRVRHNWVTELKSWIFCSRKHTLTSIQYLLFMGMTWLHIKKKSWVLDTVSYYLLKKHMWFIVYKIDSDLCWNSDSTLC